MIARHTVLRSIDGCVVPAPVGYRPDCLAPRGPKPKR